MVTSRSMPENPVPGSQAPDGVTPEPEVEPVRILFPSSLGALGIELTGELVSRVVIVPKGRERKLFRPFASLKRNERSDLLDEALGQFSEYLAGARRNFGLEYDLRQLMPPGFARRVLRQTARIPYGRTRTYQQIADAAGRPDAYRQVLSTLVANPLPILVPCHRVVTSKSGVGSYIAGPRKKNWLLRLEQKTLAMD